MKQKLDIVDVDGSYLYRKEQQLISQGINTLPLSLPSQPLTGWEIVSADNYMEKNVPKVMPGKHVCAYYYYYGIVHMFHMDVLLSCYTTDHLVTLSAIRLHIWTGVGHPCGTNIHVHVQLVI